MSAHEPFDYIKSNPRESVKWLFISLTFFWQITVGITGLAIYYIFIRLLKVTWLVIGTTACLLIIMTLILDYSIANANQIHLLDFILSGFQLNYILIKSLLVDPSINNSTAFILETFNPYISFSCFGAAVLGFIDWVFINPHQQKIHLIQQGRISEKPKISGQQMKDALENLNTEASEEGTCIGISFENGQPVTIPDQHINQVLLVLGTTGAGKTITLRHFYKRAIKKGYPLCIIDGKPTKESAEWLEAEARKSKRRFHAFNAANYCSYNPLHHGSFSELKDKIMSLKDAWDNDYYHSVAEDYLQTAIAVLQALGQKICLRSVTDCLDFNHLANLARGLKDEKLQKQVKNLSTYESKDINGLRAHFNTIINSDLGRYFEVDEKTFNLFDAFQIPSVIYFALPALKYPQFASVLGKLVMNDVKSCIANNALSSPVFLTFDEFSIFAGEQSLNLANMGRGLGLHTIFGTQGLAELDKVDPTFKRQLMNCANSVICHRINDADSAEEVAMWVSTEKNFSVTAQMNKKNDLASMGTISEVHEFIIHPGELKRGLETGEAFYATKLGYTQQKIKIKYLK